MGYRTSKLISPLWLGCVNIGARVNYYIFAIKAQLKAKFVIVTMTTIAILPIRPTGDDAVVVTVSHHIPARFIKCL